MNSRASAFDDGAIAARPARSLSSSRSASQLSVNSVLESLRNVATLSEALRILGASVILASMSVFLLQGWSDGNDIRRYLLLLTQTGMLAAAGFAMSHLVKETKGARLFFGLALVSIPANFTILSALLYSMVQWDGGLTTYPSYAEWRFGDAASIGATAAAAMLVLVPVTCFCFAIMARRSAKPLSMHFLLLNTLLLLPVRDSVAAGSIALIGVAYALLVTNKLTEDNLALKTGEGKFALAILFLPLGIVLFRSMYFYQVDSLMIAMVGMVLFLVARQTSQFPDRSARVAVALEVVSWPLALIIAAATTSALDVSEASGLQAPVFSSVYAALALDIMRRTAHRSLAKAVGVSISIAVALSFMMGIAFWPTAISALLSIAAGVLLLLWGAASRQIVTILAGLITAAAGLLFGFDALVELVFNSSWIDLAIFGACTIVLGSVLDRHGVGIKLRLTRWYQGSREDVQEIALEK